LTFTKRIPSGILFSCRFYSSVLATFVGANASFGRRGCGRPVDDPREVLDEIQGNRDLLIFLEHSVVMMSREVEDISAMLKEVAVEEHER